MADNLKAKPKNEFDDLEVDGELPPEAEFSAVPTGQESLIAEGNAGVVYDYTKAPDRMKAPPRISLNGKTLTIEKVDIVLPPIDREWLKSRYMTKDYKYCTFAVFYSEGSQQEYYAGVRVF